MAGVSSDRMIHMCRRCRDSCVADVATHDTIAIRGFGPPTASPDDPRARLTSVSPVGRAGVGGSLRRTPPRSVGDTRRPAVGRLSAVVSPGPDIVHGHRRRHEAPAGPRQAVSRPASVNPGLPGVVEFLRESWH